MNAIAPGFIDVGMSKGMPDEAAANFIKQIPLGRRRKYRRCHPIPLLTDGELRHTGHVLNVNGGYYMG